MGRGGLGGVRAVEQGLAAQPAGDAAGFADRRLGGLVVAGAEQVPGLVAVEQGEHVVGGGGVGEVVRGAGGQRPRPAQVLVTDAQTRRSG